MYILSIVSTPKEETVSPKPVKETDQKKKEVKRKVSGFNLTTSLPHPEKYILWEPKKRNLSCWNYSIKIHGMIGGPGGEGEANIFFLSFS